MGIKLGGIVRIAVAIVCCVASGPAFADESAGVGAVEIGLWTVVALALALGAAVAVLAARLAASRRALAAACAGAARERAALDRAPCHYVRWTADGIETSPRLAPLLGLPDGTALVEGDLYRPFEAADAAALSAAVEGLRRGGGLAALTLATADRARVLRFEAPAAGAPLLWVHDVTEEARARRQAEAEAQSLRRLLDALPLPVWRRRGDLAIDYCNRAYAAAVEIEAGAPDAALPEIAAGAVPAGGRAIAARAREHQRQEREAHHIVIAGARRHLEIGEAPLADGEATAGYALDRTEVEDVRLDLARHVAAHEEVLHHLGTAIGIYGPDQRLQFYNNAFVQLWRLDEGWLRTRPTMSEVLEALRERRRLPEYADFPAFKRDQLSLFTSLMEPVEELVHLPDGTTIRSVVTPHPFGGLLQTWEDVTDALTLERSYNTLIAVQRETLDNLYEGVAAISGDGRLKLSNPAFGKIWQLPADELAKGPHVTDLIERMRELVEPRGGWPAAADDAPWLIGDREPRSGRLERVDGSVLDYATVPLPDGAVLLSFLDVSDSTRVERALRERNEALETADRLKSEFIANVSYELRTPLNTIIGFAEIMTGQYFGPLNERQEEYAKGILESSQRLLSLINDILDLASIEAGYLVLELDTIDLYELLTGVLGLTRERARKKKIALALDCPPDIGALVADERRLKQAFFNILSNAVKFTPEGGQIAVTTRAAGDSLVLSFSDTGIGMTEDDRRRAFGKFERGTNPEARRSGAGLGLSLVKSFIELHGGSVEIESEEGAGTRVICRLPIRRAQELASPRARLA